MTCFPTLILSAAVAALPGCSTSFWFTAVQGSAYERCESIKDADERSRCKSANYPDDEKYGKERAPTGRSAAFAPTGTSMYEIPMLEFFNSQPSGTNNSQRPISAVGIRERQGGRVCAAQRSS